MLSLEKYMSKLNGNNDSFWQRPRDNVTVNDNIWYRNSAVGHNTLGKFMKTISVDAGLSQLYTNHYIRASCITVLDDGGVEARHIMNVSGHKSETSIKSYSRNVSESKKHEMCTVLHSVLNPMSENLQPLEEKHVTENIVNPMPENLLLLSKASITDNLVFETDQVQEVSEAEFLSDILDQPDTMHMAPVMAISIVNNLVHASVRPVSTKFNGRYFNNIHQVHIHYHN